MGNRQTTTAEQHCHKQPCWENAVHTANSVEAYKRVVHSMFEDDHVNPGRLQVLEIFTRDVCIIHPHLAHEIWKEYNIMRIGNLHQRCLI